MSPCCHAERYSSGQITPRRTHHSRLAHGKDSAEVDVAGTHPTGVAHLAEAVAGDDPGSGVIAGSIVWKWAR